MCIFSAPVNIVAGTCIIVGKTNNNNVRIIYSNKVACDSGNIMILPVNTDKIKLVELPKEYKTLGKDIATGYENIIPKSYSTNSLGFKSKSCNEVVKIVKYGPYDVSVTKQLHKVDWSHYGNLINPVGFYKLMYDKYPDYTFIIAKISKDETNNTEDKLPICYEFKQKNKNIMLPTFHIHDGKPEGNPDWDHFILVVNGKINKYDDKIEKHNIDKYKLNLCFKKVNKLLEDNTFMYDPYISNKYVNLYRIDRNSEFPNVDLECIFENNVKINNVPTIIKPETNIIYEDFENKKEDTNYKMYGIVSFLILIFSFLFIKLKKN
jgi:hypothetical protein